ncbi:MAG TPA: transcriptional regulator GcvA [Lysobacter sp.]|nr:transcriptional regulator GcvA [Lysobacter sp.]
MSGAHDSGPRRPPPLQALRALEAAVRHESYTLAAEELALTQSAVSHQLRELEELLGEKLFQRAGRRMVPTAHARAMATRIREGLRMLESAVDGAPQRRSPGTLHLSLLPSFAFKWLIPRLGDFHQRHPEIALNVRATLDLADFRHDGIDAAIRYGKGHWDGTESVLLARETLCATASPRFLHGRLPRTLRELKPEHLIGNPFEPWTPWLRAAGLDWPEPKPRLVIGDAAMLLEAAVSGQGIALTRELLARDDIAAGRLVRVFDVAVSDERAYWLVWPKGSRKQAMITSLLEWMQDALQRR